MEKYGVVIVGCGHIGKKHIEDIYYRDSIEVIGVVDLDMEKAKEFALQYKIKSYASSYERYLHDPQVHIVIIATYVDSHLGIIEDCYKHGKHVLCEKPIVSCLDELKRFEEIVENGKIKILAGYILRHNATYRKAAEMVQEGILGKPLMFRMIQNHHAKDWERYKKLLISSSPIFDCGVHYFDVMQWFTGAKILSVNGMRTNLDEDVPEGTFNYGLVHVVLSDGSKGFYEAGWGKGIHSENVKEIIGPKGSLKIVLAQDRFTHKEEGDLIELFLNDDNEYRMINVKANYKPMWEQLKCLIQMMENDEFKGFPTSEDVIGAFKVAYYADLALRKDERIYIL